MWPFGKQKPDASQSAGADKHGGKPLGSQGEYLAVQHLRKQGLKILASNYRCPSGEADIVALDESTRSSLGSETIVFIEVKTRSSDQFLPPQSAVNDDKRMRMKKVANYYLATHDTAGLHRRFDIVAITIPKDQDPRIEHISDAFE
jgi:putative endonuclease